MTHFWPLWALYSCYLIVSLPVGLWFNMRYYLQDDSYSQLQRQVYAISGAMRAAMNPVIKVKNHLFEAARFYERQKAKAERLADFQDVLQRVGLRNPDQILEAYPFELSGGMCQRVMVAMGIIANANVLIANEPTSSLDLTTQASILEELLQLRDSGMAIILITHDLGVVAQTADDMYVIKDGKIVESGSVQEVFRAPKHPYTQYLMEPINAEELK